MSFRSMKLEVQGFAPELNVVQIGLKINRSYQHLLDAHPWSFVKNQESLVSTVAPYTTGSVQLTTGLPTVVGSGTAWTASMLGMYFRAFDNHEFYKITLVDVGTQTLTLEKAWVLQSAAASAYMVFQHQYAKPTGCKHVLSIRREINLPQRTGEWINTVEPDRTSVGEPTVWADVSDTVFEVWPVPSAVYVLRVRYDKTLPDLAAETDTPTLPERLIVKHATMACYQQLAGSADTAKTYMPLYQTMVQEQGPNSFKAMFDAAVEVDMAKTTLPTRVRVEGYDTPYGDDFLLNHDITDPRGTW